MDSPSTGGRNDQRLEKQDCAWYGNEMLDGLLIIMGARLPRINKLTVFIMKVSFAFKARVTKCVKSGSRLLALELCIL